MVAFYPGNFMMFHNAFFMPRFEMPMPRYTMPMPRLGLMWSNISPWSFSKSAFNLECDYNFQLPWASGNAPAFLNYNPFGTMNFQTPSVSVWNSVGSIGGSSSSNTDNKSIYYSTFDNLYSVKYPSKCNKLISDLETLLESERLTPAEKKKLKALKTRVETLKAKFDVDKIRKDKETETEVNAHLWELIKGEGKADSYTKLEKEVNEIIDKISKNIELREPAEGSDSTENSNNENTSNNQNTSNDVNTSNDEITSNNENIEHIATAAGRRTDFSFVRKDNDMVAAKVDNKEASGIATSIYYQIVQNLSTDRELARYIKANINKDNVVDVLLQWNLKHANDLKEDKKGLVESIIDEWYFHKDAGYEQGALPIIIALEEHAKELSQCSGIDEVMNNLAMAREQGNAVNVIPSYVAEYVNKAHAKLVEIEKTLQQT